MGHIMEDVNRRDVTVLQETNMLIFDFSDSYFDYDYKPLVQVK